MLNYCKHIFIITAAVTTNFLVKSKVGEEGKQQQKPSGHPKI
jgi:hypothetical protein